MRPGAARRSRLRITLSVLTVLAVVCVFLVRLVDIQMVQASELNAQSYNKRAVPLTLYGTRVTSSMRTVPFWRSASTVSTSPRPLRVALSSEDLNGPVLDALTKVTALTGGDPAALLAAFQADADSDFAYLAKGVTLEVYRQVMELGIGWVYAELNPSRTYPNGAVAGNLVGFVRQDRRRRRRVE